MARTREENRFNREKKIKHNKKLIESCCWYLSADLENGYYKNKHEVSKAMLKKHKKNHYITWYNK